VKRFGRILGILGLVLLGLLLVGPLIYPIPPLEGTAPPRELADSDSLFVTVEGIGFHFKTAGEGEPAFVLLHGFGASVFSWREVMAPLGEWGQAFAFDRPAFGLTERPMPGDWSGESPYTLQSQVDQTLGLMNAWGLERAILVGHSAGGRTAVLTALQHPERVEALVLVAPAVGAGGGPFGWLGPVLRTPQMRRLGPYLARSIAEEGVDILYRAWHEPSQITDEILDGYTEPLQAQNWDRAYYELVAAGGDADVASRLEELTMPILIITGDDDQIVPTAGSIELAAQLPAAELVVVPDCGHLPHEERPAAFMEAVGTWLGTIGDGSGG
jgi:pimeloyl-ACP methyl ester carboxylesterase